jgi:hypothetical protein
MNGFGTVVAEKRLGWPLGGLMGSRRSGQGRGVVKGSGWVNIATPASTQQARQLAGATC